MVKYSRTEIIELSRRLETRAMSRFSDSPEAAGDMRAAAVLLRLMLQLSGVETVETTAPGLN
jgi:hypothetical protein